MIICVLGYPGSGKTVLAKEVCKVLNMPLVEVSEFVKVAAGNKDGHKRRDLQNLQKDELEKQNHDWLWTPIHTRLLELEGHCVLSGIREPYLLHKLLQAFSDVFIIGLEVNLFNRYSRLCNRDGFVSVKNFRLADNGTVEDRFVGDNTLGLDITITRCDVILDGNKNIENVLTQLHKCLAEHKIFDRTRSQREVRQE